MTTKMKTDELFEKTAKQFQPQATDRLDKPSDFVDELQPRNERETKLLEIVSGLSDRQWLHFARGVDLGISLDAVRPD